MIFDILLYIFAFIVTTMVIIVIGGSFRSWNEGKEKMSYESPSTSILKSFFTGFLLIFTFMALIMLAKSC